MYSCRKCSKNSHMSYLFKECSKCLEYFCMPCYGNYEPIDICKWCIKSKCFNCSHPLP